MHRKKHIFCGAMVIIIIAIDQITKYFADRFLGSGKSVILIPGVVQLRYVRNTGMAFSLLSGARWVFISVTIVVCCAIIFSLFSDRVNNLWAYWSLGVILSGGIGNLIDRIAAGYVIDFIEPLFVNFAVFNIADCAVTCGAVSLVLYFVFDSFKKEPKDGNKTNE